MLEKMASGAFTMMLALFVIYLIFRFPAQVLVIAWLIFVAFAIIVDREGD